MGAHIIDCDAVYRELLTSSTKMNRELEERFPGVLDRGVLNRKKLASIVFKNPSALADLNAITHKYIEREVDRRIAKCRERGGSLLAIDAIALIESGFAEKCDTVVSVVAPPGIRAERLIIRDGITRDEAMMRINAQKPDGFYRDNCDFILENNNGDTQFRQNCGELFINIIKSKGNELNGGQ